MEWIENTFKHPIWFCGFANISQITTPLISFHVLSKCQFNTKQHENEGYQIKSDMIIEKKGISAYRMECEMGEINETDLTIFKAIHTQ